MANILEENENTRKLLSYLEKILKYEVELLDIKIAYSKCVEMISICSEYSSTRVVKPEQKKYDSTQEIWNGIIGFGSGIFAAFIFSVLFRSDGLTFLAFMASIVIPICFIISAIIKNSNLEEVNNKKMEEYNILLKEDNKRIVKLNEEKEFYEREKEKLKDLIDKKEINLRSLYEMNILHEKYQELEAVIGIYDSLITGRTNSLELNNIDRGAYNLYEEKALPDIDQEAFNIYKKGVIEPQYVLLSMDNGIYYHNEEILLMYEKIYKNISQSYKYESISIKILASTNDEEIRNNLIQVLTSKND